MAGKQTIITWTHW